LLKISYADCTGLSLAISAQFTLEMNVTAQNCQKIYKNPYFSIQTHPGSLLSVSIETACMTSY